MHQFNFSDTPMPAQADGLRREIRSFLAEQVRLGAFEPRRNSWVNFDAALSRMALTLAIIDDRGVE